MNTERDMGMETAVAEARQGLAEAGIPVGSALVDTDGILVGQGRNRRVQEGDPIAHGEMDCLRRAGRQRSYAGMTLYTTLSPCLMCAGTIAQFGIARVVIGENQTFGGNEEFLREHGVTVEVLDDVECKQLMDTFIERYPEVWKEDIGEE